MGYEDSKACKLLATHCACCSKPLVDAESVNTGMGPICRNKHGYADGPQENRVRANKLVYEIAALQNGDAVAAKVKELHELGFTKLANRIVVRLNNIIRIEQQTKEWWVWAPFRSGLNFAWNQEVPGSVWDRQLKLRRVPLKAGGALRAFLLRHLRDVVVIGALPPEDPAAVKAAADAAQAAAQAKEDERNLIKITEADSDYYVYAPYREDLFAAWRTIPGQCWDSVRKARRVPKAQRAALWTFLRRHFVGQKMRTPQGITVIEKPETVPCEEPPHRDEGEATNPSNGWDPPTPEMRSKPRPSRTANWVVDGRKAAMQLLNWFFLHDGRLAADRQDVRRQLQERLLHQPLLWEEMGLDGLALAAGFEPRPEVVQQLQTAFAALLKQDARPFVERDTGWQATQRGNCYWSYSREVAYASKASKAKLLADVELLSKDNPGQVPTQIVWDGMKVTLSYTVDSSD